MTDRKLNAIEAFIKAKSEMDTPKLNKVNPHFKSKYSDLDEIKRSTQPALHKNNLSYGETFCYVGEDWGLCGKITYIDDTVVSDSFYPIDKGMKAQQKGSEITYARRYVRSAACDVVANEDDDGNEAQKAEQTKKAVSSGPLGITELKKRMRELSGELTDCDDVIQIDGMAVEYKEVLIQCKRDLAEWYTSAMEAIERRKTELRNEE